MPDGDHEFDPPVLAALMVQGAAEGDPVRLHGAIEASLQLYPDTASEIFDQACRVAAERSERRCVPTITAAVAFHLVGTPVAELRSCPHCDADTVQEYLPIGRSFAWRCSVCGRRSDEPDGVQG